MFVVFVATFGLILAIYNITGGVQSFLQSFDIITPLSFSLFRLVRLQSSPWFVFSHPPPPGALCWVYVFGSLNSPESLLISDRISKPDVMACLFDFVLGWIWCGALRGSRERLIQQKSHFHSEQPHHRHCLLSWDSRALLPPLPY